MTSMQLSDFPVDEDNKIICEPIKLLSSMECPIYKIQEVSGYAELNNDLNIVASFSSLDVTYFLLF